MSTVTRGRRWVAVPIVTLTLLVALAAPATADQKDDQARLKSTKISSTMLAESVADVGGERAASTVLALPADGSVTGLEKAVQSDGTSVVTLTSDLLFEFGKAVLTATSAAAIPDVVAGIAQGTAVAVDGYTDSLGEDGINVPLSQQRAQAVAAALAAARPDLVLTVTGHGSADPVAPNEVEGADNPVGRAQNRRVALTYTAP